MMSIDEFRKRISPIRREIILNMQGERAHETILATLIVILNELDSIKDKLNESDPKDREKS